MLLAILLTHATLIASLPTIQTQPLIPSDSSCTFTLWLRQQASTTYIQLNTILDHANNITLDVAAHRPVLRFNSYTLLDLDHVFAVTGLLDGANLTISRAAQDELRFQVGELEWDTHGGRGGAGCNAWDWKGGSERRERKLECLFPCEKVEDEDWGDGYGGVREEGQVRVALQ